MFSSKSASTIIAFIITQPSPSPPPQVPNHPRGRLLPVAPSSSPLPPSHPPNPEGACPLRPPHLPRGPFTTSSHTLRAPAVSPSTWASQCAQ